MNDKNESEIKLSCNICMKYYSSMSSLCNHNKKFHKNKFQEIQDICKEKKNISQVKNKIHQCKYCNKFFSFKQSRYDHQKNYCKERNNIIDNNTNKDEINIENKQLEIKKFEFERIYQTNETIKLKIELQKIRLERIKIKNEIILLKIELENNKKIYYNQLLNIID